MNHIRRSPLVLNCNCVAMLSKRCVAMSPAEIDGGSCVKLVVI